MRGKRLIGLALAGLSGLATVLPAEAGCTRSIINRSWLYASVSRDGGPWVTIPPNAAQPIRLEQPGRIEVSLSCAPLGAAVPASPVYRGAFTYMVAVDRCYQQFDDGFFRDYLGGGFFGFRNTSPLTLNNPRQGDIVIGPQLNGSCPYSDRVPLQSRY